MVFRAVRFSVWKNLSIVCTVRGVHRELCLLQRNFAAAAFSPPTSLIGDMKKQHLLPVVTTAQTHLDDVVDAFGFLLR